MFDVRGSEGIPVRQVVWNSAYNKDMCMASRDWEISLIEGSRLGYGLRPHLSLSADLTLGFNLILLILMTTDFNRFYTWQYSFINQKKTSRTREVPADCHAYCLGHCPVTGSISAVVFATEGRLRPAAVLRRPPPRGHPLLGLGLRLCFSQHCQYHFEIIHRCSVWSRYFLISLLYLYIQHYIRYWYSIYDAY